jgi:hypothetical protein
MITTATRPEDHFQGRRIRDTLQLAEPARVCRVISDYSTRRPFARQHPARSAFGGMQATEGRGGPDFWGEERLDFGDLAVAGIADLAASKAWGSW